MDQETVASLRSAIVLLARRLRQQVAGHDAPTPTEMAVLGRVGRCGPMTPSQLARAEHVQPPSMTKIIESLEGQGLLRRQPHPTDGRQYLVVRTQAAEALISASRQMRSQWLVSHIDRLSVADRQAVTAAAAVLARLAEMP